MTRVVRFSAGHRYWSEGLSPEENRARFGEWASPYNHGHDYRLEATVAGPVDPDTGMVVNIKRVDDLLKERILAPFHLRSLNDEVAEFRSLAPSLENLIAVVRRRLTEGGGVLALAPEPGSDARVTFPLVALRIAETDDLWADWSAETDAMTLTRSYEFAAAHRLDSAALTPERNAAVFGKCNHVHGHGHNYMLEVTVGGEPDPETGMLVDLGALDAAVEREILDRYDHRNLDLDVEELAGLPTTSENVARAIFARLRPVVPAELRRVRLWETARNAFDVEA